ncbi:MAG: RsiV family protein [bacterium]|nr:RsiV family protein [bacterium]
MKHLLLFAIVGLFAVSCSTTEEILDEVSDEINLPDRIASGRAKAYAYNMDRSDSTESMIDYQYFTPQFSSGVMDSVYKDSVNARIVELAAMQSPETETQLLGPLTDYYFERVVDDFTVDEEDDEDDFNMWTWEMQAGFDISETSRYVCLNSHGWAYTGGAHGNGFLFYEYFLKQNGQRIGLEYFAEDMESLLTIAEKYFRSHIGLEQGESLNDAGFWFEDDTFALNDNFVFEEDFMTFVFNPYEVAPYAAGMIEFSIPLEELSGIITQ